MIDLSGAPFPVTYRELYLPRGINENASLPSSKYNGHELAFTGARKGTTADGVHFNGAANSNIIVANNAIQNGQQAFAITIRFKLDSIFEAGAASNFYLFQKIQANEWIRVYLNAADGKLRWEQGDGAGANQFQLTSTTISWAAGVWHIVTLSLTSTPTQRLLVNGQWQDGDTAAARVTPGAGDMVIGNSVAAGVDGVIGVISWVVIGVGTTAATALTVDEETDLSKGMPPPSAKVQYMQLLDEGRGVTAYDRGSAGGNGTIGAVCTWAWGRVKQPVLSLDGINDHAQSSAGIDITLPWTLVWVGKMKTAIPGGSSSYKQMVKIYVDAANYLSLRYRINTGLYYFISTGGGAGVAVSDLLGISIDDYGIFVATSDSSVSLFFNGLLVGSDTGGEAISGAAATAYIGATQVPNDYSIDKPLLVGLIEGAFTQKQARAYSRWLDRIFNLGLGI